jgi:hypothetical protein
MHLTNRATFLGLLSLLTATAQAHIDLTPTPTEYVAEGITFRRLIFRQADNSSVRYEPPRGWTCRGGGDQLQLTPGDATRAQAAIQAVPLAAAQALDDKSTALLREEFLNNLPPGSQLIKLLKEEQNPVVLDNKLSYAVTASYQILGETFVRSTVFTNLGNTQLRFTINSRQSDFERLQQNFRRSIFSWQRLDPAVTTPGQTTASK